MLTLISSFTASYVVFHNWDAVKNFFVNLVG